MVFCETRVWRDRRDGARSRYGAKRFTSLRARPTQNASPNRRRSTRRRNLVETACALPQDAPIAARRTVRDSTAACVQPDTSPLLV